MYYFKTFLRFLNKNRLFTGITVFGFSIALMFVVLLSVYIDSELAVNDFQLNKDRIYRIENEDTFFSAPIADDLKNTVPEIEDFTRLLNDSGNISRVDGQKFKFDFFGVDASFFEIFSYPLSEGRPAEVLQARNSIVLSESLALKIFGSASPVGKEILIDNKNKFLVTGVMKDFPEATHFERTDALINMKAFEDLWGFKGLMTEYGFCSMNIYFLAKPNTDLPSKAPQILEKFKKDFWLYTDGYAKTLEFTPLEDVYFSEKEAKGVKTNSKKLIVVLSVIALLILLLAIINYINLTIAQASFRGKEVAVKKLLGSSKRKLLTHFTLESVFLCLVALVFSLVLAKLAEPVFNRLLDTELLLNQKISLKNVLWLLGIFTLVGLISGLVPALFMSNFKPIEMVKGTFQKQTKARYGKFLVTFQYTVTISLIICTAFVAKQTHFLRNTELGFEKDHIIWMDYVGSTDKKQTIKSALLQLPEIEQVSLVLGSPLNGGNNQSFDYKGKPVSFQEFAVDSSFIDLFGLKVRSRGTAYDRNGIYLNEIAVKQLEVAPDAATFRMYDADLPLLGTVNDFNFRQLSEHIGPAFIREIRENEQPWEIMIKTAKTDPGAAMEKIKAVYAGLVDNTPFEYGFIDDTINEWYSKEEKTARIIGYFTVLSLFISALGILGMATFYMQQRRKEIGVRRVHGSSVAGDMLHLSRDFIKWVGVAFLLSIPISFFSMSSWLENFAYKTSLSWWVFALGGMITLFIALTTVSWQSWKSATENPINVLKAE
ncbi:FtsX-like permease family protein [Leptobacterium flavescens]|uniref:FtsX-like permease family protein n=1 Tax=Leptobacterium flavescens TaxID=472055 RepID=A0A6P0UKF3_9FLAO|nr:ABC transporter permease [Leptobacterium flavescens]NER13032.1 FtsX-like permease family protein [Leptobacterium flavescens]